MADYQDLYEVYEAVRIAWAVNSALDRQELSAGDVYPWIVGADTDEDVERANKADKLIAEAIGGMDLLEELDFCARVIPGVRYFLGIDTAEECGGVNLRRVREEVIARRGKCGTG